MGFIERLRQEDSAKALRAQQLKAQQEAQEREGLQREKAEEERRAKRREQAEKFREESGVGTAVAKLGEYLKYVGRGSSSKNAYAGDLPIFKKDPDSTFDIADWDAVSTGIWKKVVLGSDEYFTKKYIAVETRPDGTIVFHAGWLGSTTIGLVKWRTEKKEQLFDKALEKAYQNPGVHRYSTFHEWRYIG